MSILNYLHRRIASCTKWHELWKGIWQQAKWYLPYNSFRKNFCLRVWFCVCMCVWGYWEWFMSLYHPQGHNIVFLHFGQWAATNDQQKPSFFVLIRKLVTNLLADSALNFVSTSNIINAYLFSKAFNIRKLFNFTKLDKTLQWLSEIIETTAKNGVVPVAASNAKLFLKTILGQFNIHSRTRPIIALTRNRNFKMPVNLLENN